ncbi:MAG: phosphatidylinositol mannoside acyltransferase, partial [Nonomuraea sp.]|nr:phosphatidylinositol mannoside acyltransferase [Nonomuraea sp.]
MKEQVSFGDRVVAAGFAAGWKLVPLLPQRPTAAVFRVLADRVWRRRGKSVRRLESNLSRVTGIDAGSPELRELSRAGMRSYFRYFHEIFRLPSIPRA